MNRCLAVVGMLLAILGCAELLAQGPAYREHWTFLHLEHRRLQLLRELAGCDADELKQVAALSAAPDQGLPFRPVAAGLAARRGVELDDALLLRAMISVFVLPEVVDPDGSNSNCRRANLTVFLPYSIELPGEVTFDVAVIDAGNQVVWQQRLSADTDSKGLRMARPRVSVPVAELADGAYRVTVKTVIDGQPPRAHDPKLEWTVHVQRGYQQRAETAMQTALDVREQLPPLQRALLDGLRERVARAYRGEAFAGTSDAVRRTGTARTRVAQRGCRPAGADGHQRAVCDRIARRWRWPIAVRVARLAARGARRASPRSRGETLGGLRRRFAGLQHWCASTASAAVARR